MKRLWHFFFRPRPSFVPDIPMLATCMHCHKLTRLRALNKMTVHLIEHHRLEHQKAYDTVNWVANRMHEHMRERSKACQG